jgi:hypothetical protein
VTWEEEEMNGNKRLRHIWVVVRKNENGSETIINPCRSRSLARSICGEYKRIGRSCVVRKFVSTT